VGDAALRLVWNGIELEELRRLPPRRGDALVVALFGLVIGTAAGGFAVDFLTMILARVVAGAFGGPATSLGIAIIADAVPAERRGKAMGVVMGGFSIASVLGVPAGLKLAEWGSWRTTFYGVAALIAAVTFVAARVLPPFRGHIAALPPPGHALESLKAMLAKGRILLSLMMTALANVGAFILILNFPAFIQFNVGFPRADLDKLYLIGGIASFASMRAAGFLVDRFGSTRVGAVGAALLLVVNYLGFVRALPVAWVIPIFVAFFIVNAFRNVAYSTLTSKVPEPSERARFLSIQSAVQHGASAFAAVLATQLLGENPDKSIAHMERVTFTSMALTACVPVAMWLVERTLKKRGSAG
jgi:predicted MFS family arabinose efflux permease